MSGATLEQEPQTADAIRGPQIGRAELEHDWPTDRANDGGGHAGGGGTPPPPPARRRGYGGENRLPRWQAALTAFGILLLAIAIAGIAHDMLRELGREDER